MKKTTLSFVSYIKSDRVVLADSISFGLGWFLLMQTLPA
jgi:hypothetical protein